MTNWREVDEGDGEGLERRLWRGDCGEGRWRGKAERERHQDDAVVERSGLEETSRSVARKAEARKDANSPRRVSAELDRILGTSSFICSLAR